MKTYAVIPAAGLGKRFGAKKQFQLLAGTPILVHTLLAFETTPIISGVCLAVPEDEMNAVNELISQNNFKKIIKIVPGGKERQDSVRKGFEALPACDIVLVHDGVRPLISQDIIERTIEGAKEFGGCVAALPVKETTKHVNESGVVHQTIDRSSLWSIQTPQAFRYDIFRRAVEQSVKDSFLGTDESMLVERIGEKVKVVLGHPYNIKVTHPEDLRIAEAFLSLRKA